MATSMAVIPAAAGEDIEGAIRRSHAAATSAAETALGHALECGRLLAEAREGIGHGGWETFVRERCDIAPRTARVYLRLHANRERLANRQHVAGLTVREAVRELTVPRAIPETEVAALAGDAAGCGDELPLKVPEWYQPGHSHAGVHPSGWCFQVWPHPHGEPWAHFFIMSPPSGFPGDENATLTVPKCGVRSDFLVRCMEFQCVNGMPTLNDPGWKIGCLSDDADPIGRRDKFYNSMLFTDDEDYRRRGMGIQPRRKPRHGAPA